MAIRALVSLVKPTSVTSTTKLESVISHQKADLHTTSIKMQALAYRDDVNKNKWIYDEFDWRTSTPSICTLPPYMDYGTQYYLTKAECENLEGTWDSGIVNILLSEVLVKVINKPLTESISLAELTELHYSKIPSTETVSVVETFAKVVTWHRTPTDAFTLDDAATIDKDYYGNKGNVATILDILGVDLSKPATDSYTVADVIVIAMSYVRAVNDSVSTGDVSNITNRSGAVMNGTFFNNITLN